MSTKSCPECNLVNPETSLRCDCGYEFQGDELTSRSDFKDDPLAPEQSPLTTLEWMTTLIILMLPVINLVVAFIWAFSSTVNVNRRNFSRATLALAAIGLGLSLVFSAFQMLFLK